MCDYCGCQAIEAIADLTAEHDAVVTLIGTLRPAAAKGDLDAVAGYCRGIAAVLGPHTAVEEQGLFPAIAGEFPDHVRALEHEHRDIESVLDEARSGVPADPTWLQRLLPALDVLRDHILKEQDGVFPAALATLDSEDWERLGTVREAAGSAVKATA
jgi:hemerythrin-like domain-containing protein